MRLNADRGVVTKHALTPLHVWPRLLKSRCKEGAILGLRNDRDSIVGCPVGFSPYSRVFNQQKTHNPKSLNVCFIIHGPQELPIEFGGFQLS